MYWTEIQISCGKGHFEGLLCSLKSIIKHRIFVVVERVSCENKAEPISIVWRADSCGLRELYYIRVLAGATR